MSSPDLLIVLGKNIGIGSTREDIRRDPAHLSDESRMNALAAGVIYQAHAGEMDVLFSSGHTAGSDIPSEAAAMKAYFKRYYPSVPDERLLTEEASIDTPTNAIEVAKWAADREGPDYGQTDLLSVGHHVVNAATLFRGRGGPIYQTIASEDIVKGLSREKRLFVEHWLGTRRVQEEILKERARGLLLHIDRRGWLQHAIVKLSLSRG